MGLDDPNWSQGLQGAGGGAMAGGAVGGPWGAAVGAGIGGIAGLFGGGGASDYQDQLKKLAAGYGSRTAPQAGAMSQSGYSDFRRNQAGLIAQLEAAANGTGPSAAQQQMQASMDRAAGAQASALAGAGGRGVNAGAAFRQATNNTAAVQAQGARDTSILRAQEQLNARGQLGQAIGQGRAADEANNQFNAEQQNRGALANLQAQLQTMGLNDEAQLKALMAAMGVAGPGMGASLLAGGANAMPGLMQMMNARNKQGQGQGAGAMFSPAGMSNNQDNGYNVGAGDVPGQWNGPFNPGNWFGS